MNSDKKNSDRVFLNQNIRVPKVFCIDEQNVNLGIINTSEALKLAQDAGLDLVQVSPPTKDRPPTCKITDYGKYRYDASKKKKEAEKKQREQQNLSEPKEIKFRPVTDMNDLQIKAKKTEEFLSEGFKVKISIIFKGRELSHKEVAYETLDHFMSFLPNCQLAQNPSMAENGKTLTTFVVRKDQ